ncbi:MAG: oligosaccharide flippase family protein [Candidatus Sungbacteria bacterium]|nr:oligosaccharide flippase family protein [Candidatus Sungbacteria bacterium]
MNYKPPHSFAERFVRGNLLGRLWGSANTFVGLTSSFLTLTALSVYEFGLYQLVLSALVLYGVFSVNLFDEVVQNDITRELGDNRKEKAKRLFTEIAFLKIGFGVVVTFALFFGADIVAKIYGKDIGSYIQVASFIAGLRAIRSIGELFLGAVVSLRGLGAAAVEEASKLVLVSWFFFFGGLSISTVLAATLVGVLISLVYVAMPFFREYRGFLRGVTASKEFVFKSIVKRYGPWLLLRSAVKKAAKPVQPWLIVTFLGTEAVALYALAANLITMVKGLFPAAASSLLAWEVNDFKRLSYIFGRGMKYSLLFGMVLAAAAFFFVPLVVGFLFPKYLSAIPLFTVFLVSVPFHGMQQLEMAVLTALREQKVLAARLFAEIAINFGLFILLAPFIGILAAGVGGVVPVIWRTWFLYRQIGKKYPVLGFPVGMFFSFDEDDRLLMRRALLEGRSFFRSATGRRRGG